MVNTQTIPACASAQDSIFRDFTQISTESPQIRWLTMYYGMYKVRGPDGRAMSVPMLRLQGAWLERAGFAIGVPVKVHVSPGRLVIEAAESERVPQAEVLGVLGALVADEGLTKRDFDDLERRLRRLGRSD
jgi:Toxin SymE, type I toxin-antitoxin system